jgi:ribosomal protein L17
MLEDLNPFVRKNPMWQHVKDLKHYQKWDIIPKESIDLTLSRMEEVNAHWERTAALVGDGRTREQLLKGVAQFRYVINGVRADLTKDYKLVDGNYIKLPKPMNNGDGK